MEPRRQRSPPCWPPSPGARRTSRSPSCCPPAGPCSWPGCASCPAGVVLVLLGTLVVPVAAPRSRVGRTVVLALFNFGLFFPLLVVAVYRLPGGVAAAVGGIQPLLVLPADPGGRRGPAPAAGPGGRRGRRRRGGPRRGRPGADIDLVGAAGRRRRQRLVLDGRGADQAVPGPRRPARRDRLAAARRRPSCSPRSPSWSRARRRRSPDGTWPAWPTSASSARRWPTSSGSAASGACPQPRHRCSAWPRP